MKATATTVHRLIQGSKVFLIPTFQRRYTWRKDQWVQLWNDLTAEYELEHPDEPEALYGHFLGSVVLHPALGPASTLMRHQVIDGQQRLTTILILLAALRDVRKEVDREWNPASIDDQYLRNPFSDDYPDRLVPTKLDREAYRKTMRMESPTGDIGVAYTFFRSTIERAHGAGEVDLARLENTLLLNMLIVEITTKTGDSVNSIFNTLNSKGMDLSPADLVRNEILHHVGSIDGEEAHEQFWIPMEIALVNPRAKASDREFVTFLWSREVALNPRTKRDDLFSVFEKRLRAALAGMSVGERRLIALVSLKEMFQDHLLFLVVRDPSRGEDDSRISPRLLASLQLLKDWRSEPTTPIALWILKNAVEGHIEQDDAAEAVEILMSFLVKRTMQGIPTNQLNRLLTPVASELAGRPPGVTVRDRMRTTLSKQGYYWPSDDQVRANVVTNPLYASARRYVKFLLSIAEAGLPGMESADLSKSQIEHVMPQVLSPEWVQYLTSVGVDLTEAEALTHTLGNLTLTDNNQKMGNASFERKRSSFFNDSALRLNRSLSEFEQFGPTEIADRSRKLADVILERFTHSPASSSGFDETESGSSVDERLVSLLQTIPVGRWVTDEDLVSVLGAPEDEVRLIVQRLDPVLVRLIRSADRSVPLWMPSDLAAAVHQQDAAQFDLTERMFAEELSDWAAGSDHPEDRFFDEEADSE